MIRGVRLEHMPTLAHPETVVGPIDDETSPEACE